MKEAKNTVLNNCQLSKDILLKILDNSYDAIFATDKNGVTIYANKASEKYYGIKSCDVIGKDPWQFMEKAGCYPPVAPIALYHGKVRQTLEQSTRTGAKMVVTTTPIYDREGNIELLIQNCRDVRQLEDTKSDLEQTKEMLTRMQEEVVQLRKKELQNATLVSDSKSMKDLLEFVEKIAGTDINVLVLGETGTGKSILAKHIHKTSDREDGPFININCAAIPQDLIESELFGYSPGAFTGALNRGKTGLIELANEGTLFLDEIAELPLHLQGKILDVIQEHRFIPVGGSQVKQIDCRIIAATNRDIKEMVEKGTFREDLYYRLNVIELELSPLRERPDDILPLVYFFLNRFNTKYKKEHDISVACRNMLIDYPWPGNIRELENMIERLVVVVEDSIIDISHLPKVFSDRHAKKYGIVDSGRMEKTAPEIIAEKSSEAANSLDVALSQLERNVIIEAFNKYGSTRKVAHALNMSQSRAHRLIEKYCKITVSDNAGI
jgi:PAS domain S-box-containing protein